MKTVKILEDFTGYPAGKKASFAKGTEVSVSDAFADLIIAKGHAKEQDTPPTAPKAAAAAAKGTADENLGRSGRPEQN